MGFNLTPLGRNDLSSSCKLVLILVGILLVLVSWRNTALWVAKERLSDPLHAEDIIKKCRSVYLTPGPPPDFHKRTQNDRFEPTTPPTLIQNATIWTGRANGTEIIQGDLLLDRGLIISIGHVPPSTPSQYGPDLQVFNANGSWLTPGLVDMHSHLGVYSAPLLSGATEDNSYHGPILPFLRSLDALNTHDASYALSVSGGVTSSLVLPGSVNTIAGQAFAIKLRPTAARSTEAMLLEPPSNINGSRSVMGGKRWRHMKFACGQNAMWMYGNTRMDDIWGMRSAFETAQKIREAQDEYCGAVTRGEWEGVGEFPEEMEWEALVDVLRGRVKVHVHCYEAVDIGDMILMSQEFKFPIAAFHHAHESYLITEQLKTAFGGHPASALFATHARYKRESYRGSEFAPKILHDAGLPVVLKSDHPVLNSRDLIHEAHQAHYHGLPPHVALSALTSTPARVMGLDHRIGMIEMGYDADVVVWDSHPLALGATPKQVWIDGIAQIERPYVVPKGEELQRVPVSSNWDEEIREVLQYDRLPPLEPKKRISGTVVFTNVSMLYLRDDEGHSIKEIDLTSDGQPGTVVVTNGKIICYSPRICTSPLNEKTEYLDLRGGSIGPGLTSFGSHLGMGEMSEGEPTSNDFSLTGFSAPSLSSLPDISGGAYGLLRAADGLMYGTRDALTAYLRGGVTTAVARPQSMGFVVGLGAAFSTSAKNKLEEGALISAEGVVYVRVSMGFDVSVSAQIGILRRLLMTKNPHGDLDAVFMDIAQGKRVLAITVSSADIMASLLLLKSEVEAHTGRKIRMTFVGAQEAHLLACEIAGAGVGVILVPARPYHGTWEERRILSGPPLTEKGAVQTLMEAGVTVGLGSIHASHARNIRLDVSWAAIEAGGAILKTDAYALATTNLERLLGVHPSGELVATSGGDLLDSDARPAACISSIRGVVDVF